ncbi:unnamed protein product [Rotaria sp. Silwood1]|nr:unnamed protein product [Rotaria sp. Silwood1]
MWSQILLETLLRMPSPPINKHKDLTIDEFEQNYRCTDAITCEAFYLYQIGCMLSAIGEQEKAEQTFQIANLDETTLGKMMPLLNFTTAHFSKRMSMVFDSESRADDMNKTVEFFQQNIENPIIPSNICTALSLVIPLIRTVSSSDQCAKNKDRLSLSSNHPSLMHIQTRICRAHQGDHGHAMAYYEAALIIYKLWLDEDDPWRTYLIANMARSALDLGDDKKAHQIL